MQILLQKCQWTGKKLPEIFLGAMIWDYITISTHKDQEKININAQLMKVDTDFNFLCFKYSILDLDFYSSVYDLVC